MLSRTTARFRRAYKALPAHVRAQAREAYRSFPRDPQYSGLRLQQVHCLQGDLFGTPWAGVSGPRGPGLGGLGVVWIGSHADYDRLLKQL